MSYTYGTQVTGRFDSVVDRTVQALKDEGFGVLTDIDVSATMKSKLGKDIPNYRILGACNPPYAYQALMAEPKIGAMLPCNVIVRQEADGSVEVSAINPLIGMEKVGNAKLTAVAQEVAARLQRVIANIGHSKG